MRLSTKSRYAVMAMVDLARHALQYGLHVPLSLAIISVRQELPLPYLEQLFTKLRKAGLVKSARGAYGGYVLSTQPSDTRILDIIKAVDVPIKTTRCGGSDKGCKSEGQRCLTHDLWEELSAVVQVFLNHISLNDICERRIIGMGHFLFLPAKDIQRAYLS